MTETFMAAEIAEAGAAARRQLAANAQATDELAARLRAQKPAFVVTIARGSSDHAALFLKYAVEIRLGLACASLGPSIASLYQAPLHLGGAVAVAISQSGRSPDIVAMQRAAKQGGATTVALVNDARSPVAEEADALLPLHAGEERSVAATKSMIASLVAGVSLIAALGRGRGACRGARPAAVDPRRLVRPSAGRCSRDAGEEPVSIRDRPRRDLRGRRRGGAEAQGDLGHSRRGVLVGRSAARAGRRHHAWLPGAGLRARRRRARGLLRDRRPPRLVRRRPARRRRRAASAFADAGRARRRAIRCSPRSPRCTPSIAWRRRSRADAAATPTSRRI